MKTQLLATTIICFLNSKSQHVSAFLVPHQSIKSLALCSTATGDNIGPLLVPSTEDTLGVDTTLPQEADEECTLKARKTRVILGYKAMTLSFSVLAVTIIANLAKKGAALQIPMLISGLVMAGGVSFILIGATKNERLGSDTYKRLNLTLLLDGLISLPIIVLAARPEAVSFFLLSIINASKGYGFGVIGWDRRSSGTGIIQDVINGLKNTAKGILFSVPKNIKSFGYLTAIAVTAQQIFSKVIIMKELLQSGASLMEIAKVLAMVGRMGFAASLFYTLKDAADRNRLGGTTFIQLNFLSAFTAAAFAVAKTGSSHFASTLVPAAYAIFFALNGLSSYMERNAV